MPPQAPPASGGVAAPPPVAPEEVRPTDSQHAAADIPAATARTGTATPEPASVPPATVSPGTAPVATAPDPTPKMPPPVETPLAPEVVAAIADIRAVLATGDAQGAAEHANAAEKRLGENAALRLEGARAHLALAEQEISGNGDPFLVQGHVADAHLRWKQATAMDGNVRGAAVLRARILRFEEKPRLAKELLAEHLLTHVDDPDALTVLAEMATNAREWETADTLWTKIAALNPANGAAFLEAGIAKQWVRSPAATLERYYLEACRLLKDDERPLKALASIYPTDRDRKLALFRRVVTENPSAVWARVWIAYILRKEGAPDVGGAVEVLREAAALAPTNVGVHFNLAETLSERKAPASEILIEFVIAAENSKPGTVTKIAEQVNEILHARGDSAGIPIALRVRACDAIAPRMTDSGWFANNAGLWFRDVGQNYELSLKYYLESVRAEPDEQDYINDCALIYLFHLTDRKEQCLPMFLKVRRLVEEEGVDKRRGYWDTLENLSKYWFEAGDYAKCLECAQKRMDTTAKVDGRPYPSMKAAGYRGVAEKKLKEKN